MQINLTEAPKFADPSLPYSAVTPFLDELPANLGRQLRQALDAIAEQGREEVALRLYQLASVDGTAQGAAAWLLLRLACAGHLLLPLGGVNLRSMVPSQLPLELPPLLAAVDDYVKEQKPRWASRGEHFELLLATDCRGTEGFDIHGFERLHNKWAETRETGLSLAAPTYMLLRALEVASALSRDLRHSYILWRASEQDKAMSFAEFLADPKLLAGMRIHGKERERIELPVHQETRRRKEVARAAQKRESRVDHPYVQNLKAIAAEESEDAPERYFGALTGSSNTKGFRPEFWLDEPCDYPGFASANVAALGEKWFTAFKAFLLHRQKDYETDKQVRSALHVLADYLLLYLPWWRAKHPETRLSFPDSPSKFLRYYYVDRTRFHEAEAVGLGELPKTLNELLPLRRPSPDARNTARIILQKFFAFVLTYFEDSEDFVTKGMQNPFRSDFDNEVSGRRTKTNKVPFAEDVFPFLVHYGQAVEAFGEHLQALAYERNAFRDLTNGSRSGYDTSEWGFVPLFWYRGVQYKVSWVPNIYRIAKRTLDSNPPTDDGIYVAGFKLNRGQRRNVTLYFPHLTTVRLLNVLVETGLRAQAIQWLDRRSFDSLAPPLGAIADLHRDPQEQNYNALFVNTDKVHNAWDNLVSWRVRRALHAEARFQASVADEYVNVEVAYEDREHTRFLPIVPLFRSDVGDSAISDAVYYRRWVEFLFGFQTFYNSRNGVDRSGSPDALVLLKPKEGGEDEDRLDRKFYAIHTPHACRATYATLKDGDLEVSEISYQLGHSGPTVTNHYQVPNAKRLAGKLKEIDERRMGLAPFDAAGQGPAYLHPEREDSSLRIAFQRDRDQAINDFGFVPGVALWSLSELNGDASTLELLRQSPASVIRWHPTHVCPVGNQCPKEVVANTGGMSRCGVCPLAAKCVEHLPAIEAKQNELRERIRTAGRRQRLRSEQGAPQAEVDALHKGMEQDTKEMLGWKLSAEILRAKQRELGADHGGYHVDQPDLVRKQLQLVTRNRTESEFFLQRIADSNAYPSLESAEVRAKANRFTRLILAQQGRLEEAAFLEVPEHTELTVFASLLKPFVEAKGLTVSDVAAAVDGLSRTARLNRPNGSPLLPEA